MKVSRNFVSKVVLILAVLALAWCVPAVGQVIRGSMSGTVTDPQGAVIGGAQVKATQTDTGAVFNTTSDSSGLFRVNLIPAGSYKVEITAQGFKTLVQSNVQVTAGADRGLGALKLAVGESSTTIEVTGAAPLITTSQAQITNTFSGTTLETFSGIQENQGLDNLALFVPGVASSRDNNFSNTNGGLGFSSDGLRGRNNDQQIDGQDNNDNSVTGPALIFTDPNFVQQYVLITNNFGPEYGRNAGSVVNIITASGTNNWHGSLYATENNGVLNALPADEKFAGLLAPPRANDFFGGATAGGPLVKNKLFFFGGFDSEIVSTSSSDVSGLLTPTPAGLSTLSSCFPGSVPVANLAKFGPYGIPGGNPTPSGQVTLANIDGCPNVTEAGVSRLLSTPTDVYNFITRLDWQAGNNDLFTGRYMYANTDAINTNAFGTAPAGYPANVPALSQIVLLSWTHNFNPRMVNELRLGFDRLSVQFGGNNIGNTIPTIGNISSAVTSLNFTDATTLPFGVPSGAPQGRYNNTWQGQDNWNYVMGKHQLKAGVNYTHQQTPSTFLPGVNGQYNFSSLSNYIANAPTATLFTVGDPEIGFKEDNTFLYIGDDWKARPNLTLNLGITWSYFSQPSNILNQITTSNETGPNPTFNPALPLSLRTFPSVPVYPYTLGPSFGFAYSPGWGGSAMGGGKTVIRGGYRLSWDPSNLNIYLNNYDSSPSTLAATLSPGLPVPLNPFGTTVSSALSPSLPLGVLDPRNFPQSTLPSNWRPDHVQQWSLGVQRELGRASALEVRYVGNHASGLFQNLNVNPFLGVPASVAPGTNGLAQSFPSVIPPGVTPCTTPAFDGLDGTPLTSAALGRLNCNLGVVQQRSNNGFSNYNGLQVNYRAANLFHQLTMTASYTYSKTLDNSSEIFQTFSAGNTTVTPQNPFNTRGGGEYSFSGLDFPNVFSVQFTEQLPFFKEQHGFFGHLLGGWSGAINYIYASGQAYTPIMAAFADASARLAGLGNLYDTAFETAFNNGIGYARPFLGNSAAPVQQVGIFAGDACNLLSVGCGLPTTQLLSLNSINANGSAAAPVTVTTQQVHFIANTAVAQTLFGTPFGNIPRNYLRDMPSNVGNVSIYKNFKLTERVSFQFHTTFLNAFNHSNFQGVVPFIESAGNAPFGNVFATPSQDVDGANGLTNEIPGQTLSASRRIFFGGAIKW